MRPCAILKHEHQQIEKIIEMMREEVQSIRQTQCVDLGFIDTTADFLRSFVGQIHHAKEDMLFHAMSRRKISDEDFMMMSGLVEEHQAGRKIMEEILTAKDRYAKGDKGLLTLIRDKMHEFVMFYPRHMKKEEDVFFPHSEGYFNEEELQAMLREFRDHNERIIRRNVNQLKGNRENPCSSK